MNKAKQLHTSTQTASIRVRGQVQGVGFRPMVWRLARQWQLSGRVFNDGDGVLIEVSGINIDSFVQALLSQCPPLARIDDIERQVLARVSPDTGEFIIDASRSTDAQTDVVPDAAICPQCLADIRDPANRRYRYPFTNCTNCGPRLSIVRAIPYDRVNTSMAEFSLCSHCLAEYSNPNNRRFHAQPNACAVCGPGLWLQTGKQRSLNDPIREAVARIQHGDILALKGIGGFHLICDAHQVQAVSRLRERKRRPAKPFALMAASVEQIQAYAKVNEAEVDLLQSKEAPVVILEALAHNGLPSAIAPGQTSFGFMLPSSPLHYLIMDALEGPIVATSGNIGGLPPCIDNAQALSQLASVADVFLLHDRPIVNRVDDSVVRYVDHKTQRLRRARGYAPARIKLPPGFKQAPEVLAFGGELKNTFCLLKQGCAVLSQHMGDLENNQVYEDYCHNIELYQNLFQLRPALFAVDHHPDYLSTKLGQEKAQTYAIPAIEIQHHHAHIASCLADNHWPIVAGRVIGIVLDGIGYGDDDTLWGGEILLANYRDYRRLAHLSSMALPGGALAMRQPWRNLIAQLQHAFGIRWQGQSPIIDRRLSTLPVTTVQSMLQRQFNSPLASSTGRLFDAVAAALGLCTERIHYEGQAAIELESLTDLSQCQTVWSKAYSMTVHQHSDGPWQIDPCSLWPSLLADLEDGRQVSHMSARYHSGLAHAFSQVTRHFARTLGVRHIALSGGVMQNRLLSQLLTNDLKKAGLEVLIQQQVPANDGGLSLGQAVIAAAQQLPEEASLCV